MGITLKHLSGYKSIDNIGDIELPDFVVITGLNGSGKSQLLEAIIQQNAGVQVLTGGRELSNKKHVTHANLVPNNSGAVDANQLRSSAQSIYNQYQQYKNQKLQNHTIKLENIVRDKRQIKLINFIAEEASKPLDDLDSDDFFKYYPIDDGLVVNDVFQHNFSILFKRYHTKFEDNLFDEFKFERYEEGGFLTQDEFERKYGPPPWDLVNRVLDEAHVDYRLTTPHSTHRDAPFELHLVNKHTEAKINFNDLSSGEKVLVSMALSLYNLNMQVDFPEILLMDEPDAPLHPSMAKHFIDVVRKVFVEDKGVKVIMTTHSPSTVALCPDESIYVMNKVSPRLEKTTKDRALSLLTSGVPSLSVSYENRRQVFVESKYDQILLEGIYLRVSKNIPSDISLVFMCPGLDGSAGCSQVIEIVERLASFGNPYVYGVIDWDKKNKSSNHIRVLGDTARYSIENYILDPLILSAYLLREKIVDKGSFSLSEEETYLDIRGFEGEKLQALVDSIVSAVEGVLKNDTESDFVECSLINGYKVSIPRWYLYCQGHELEDCIKEIYKPLKRFQREGELKRDILNKVVDDLPSLLSADFITLFKSLKGL